jgi:hypothetical protein
MRHRLLRRRLFRRTAGRGGAVGRCRRYRRRRANPSRGRAAGLPSQERSSRDTGAAYGPPPSSSPQPCTPRRHQHRPGDARARQRLLGPHDRPADPEARLARHADAGFRAIGRHSGRMRSRKPVRPHSTGSRVPAEGSLRAVHRRRYGDRGVFPRNRPRLGNRQRGASHRRHPHRRRHCPCGRLSRPEATAGRAARGTGSARNLSLEASVRRSESDRAPWPWRTLARRAARHPNAWRQRARR